MSVCIISVSVTYMREHPIEAWYVRHVYNCVTQKKTH
jgi:hypothetical protein